MFACMFVANTKSLCCFVSHLSILILFFAHQLLPNDFLQTMMHMVVSGPRDAANAHLFGCRGRLFPIKTCSSERAPPTASAPRPHTAAAGSRNHSAGGLCSSPTTLPHIRRPTPPPRSAPHS